MINLNTPSGELWNTLSEEHEKAKYWMIKQFGGEKRYEAMRDKLLSRCVYKQCSLASDVVYYTSRSGNRWICFENVTFYPDTLASNSMPTCFCFYETASSLGIFMPGFDAQSEMNCVLIITPHFFQRYAERMGIEGDKMQLLLKFVTSSCSYTISPLDTDDNGLEKIVVRTSNDWTGHGIRRSGDKNVYEVRTILTDAQLSKAQTAQTERVRNLREVMEYEPEEIVQRKLACCANPIQAFNDKMDKMHALGLDTFRQENGLNYSLIISTTFMKMGIATLFDIEFWERYHKVSHEAIGYLLNLCVEDGRNSVSINELVSTARQIAARLGIKNFAWREFAHILLVDSFKLSDSEATDAMKRLFQ